VTPAGVRRLAVHGGVDWKHGVAYFCDACGRGGGGSLATLRIGAFLVGLTLASFVIPFLLVHELHRSGRGFGEDNNKK
jgi:hypothetical protein